MKRISIVFVFILLTIFLVGTANAQSGNKPDKGEKKSEKQLEDRPLKILRNSGVSINAFNKCSGSIRNRELLVRLRVTFDSSEKITDVEVVRDSGCEYFNNEAIKAAKNIKFKSAIKDGEPITVTKSIEYRVGIR